MHSSVPLLLHPPQAPGAEIQTFDPVGAIRSDDEGAFALRDFVPGPRFVQVSGPYHQMSAARLDFTMGVVDTVTVFITPNLADTGGRWSFPQSLGSGELLVRSAQHEPFRRTIEFRSAARDSLELNLGPRIR